MQIRTILSLRFSKNVNMEMSKSLEAELKSLAVSKDTEVVYNGLTNQGATDYLNSALQVLFMTKHFREAVERITPNDDDVLKQLQKLFENLKGEHKYISTVKITESLSIKNVSEHQDAVDWFEKILSVVPPDASQVYKGTLRKTLKCLKCHVEPHEDSYFFSLPISIDARLDEVFSVVDGLGDFFKTTRFDEDDWLYCDDCHEKTDMEISFDIQKYPTILTLHLKRFYFDDMKMGYRKNCCPMDIPFTLTYFESCTYDLYGVINHSGVYGCGHYNAYIQSPENYDWYCFNDSHVVKITDKDFLKRSMTACMIVYRKRESLPSSPYQEENTMDTSTEEAVDTASADEAQKEMTRSASMVCLTKFFSIEGNKPWRKWWDELYQGPTGASSTSGPAGQLTEAVGPVQGTAGQQRAAARQHGPTVSEPESTSSLKLCPPDFKSSVIQSEKDDIYMSLDKSGGRRRLALLINNVEFDRLKCRSGSEIDEQSMKILLENLGYNVVSLRNLTSQGMEAALGDFSQRGEHQQSDSCFVVLMSHGTEEGVCGTSHSKDQEDILPVNSIFRHLNTSNCPMLRDKPKVILIQACRGEEYGGAWVTDSAPIFRLRKEHREKDFICMRSCTPDTVSYRKKETGSVFIQTVVKTFNEHAHETHVAELLRKVQKASRDNYPKQMPCMDRTTLLKKFYLFPGL